jgi:ATP-dependent Clp protease ATP-binding subunit ClpA
MFERFTTGAREVVVGAQREARALGHGWIGTEHLLLAVLADDTTPVGQALEPLGLSHDAVRAELLRELGAGQDDEAALRDLGIDLDTVRRRVEERFGPGALDQPAPRSGRRFLRRHRAVRPECREDGPSGHIPFTRAAKKALELSLREALALRVKEIRVEHLVLGMMRAEGLATTVVARLGVPPDDVRRAVLDRLGRAA